MSQPGQPYYLFHGEENIEFSTSSGVGSSYCSAIAPTFNVNGSYFTSLGFPQDPAGYIQSNQRSQNDSTHVSAIALDSSIRYTDSSCYMNMAESSNGRLAAPTMASDFHSQGSSSQSSDPEYCRRQTGFDTPPSSRGGGAQQQAWDDFQDAVVGNAMIDFQGLEAISHNSRAFPPTRYFCPAENDKQPYYTHSSGQYSDGGATSNMALELHEYTPRAVVDLPWSTFTPRVGNQALFAPESGSVFDAYHVQEQMKDVDWRTRDKTTQTASHVNPPSTSQEAQGVWQHQTPEALFPPCYDFDFDELQPNIASDAVSPLSTTAGSTFRKVGGRANGYRLPDKVAENARRVRQIGSCWHCFYVKKKCSPGEPCQTCYDILNRHGFRIFNLPCDRENLQQKTRLLIPDALVAHLREEAVRAFFKDNIRESTRNNFDLVLTTGFGRTLTFEAFEFKPTPQSQLNHGVGVEIDPNTQVSQRVVRNTPFISLLLASNLMQRTVSDWLDDVLFRSLEGWPRFCYDEAFPRWQRGVLEAVCQFFTDWVQPMDAKGDIRTKWSPEQVTLRRALKLWILIFLMGHKLNIPEDEKSRIGRILNTTLPEGPVSPQLPNKIVKMALRPMVERLTRDTLSGLSVFLRSTKSSPNWSCVFCTMVLLLTVAAEIEISLDDIAACAIVQGEDRSRNEAAVEIQNLETNIPDTIITFFYARFKSPKNHNPFQLLKDGIVSGMDGATRELLRKISESVRGSHSGLYLGTDLKGMHPDNLGASNVARLLSKFLNPYFEDLDVS